MAATFQVALELTNLFNPLLDAIKKSGSDAITEMRLANLIGRHRVDDAIEVRFRHAVARAEQSFISRYIDIVLEAGAGPSVQQSLKHPALFSMVIQLSALAFSHEQENLANAMVEAIERIAKSSGRDSEIVPDYFSLLGTLRACQEQTAAFHWAPVYEAVEYKIESGLRKAKEAPRSVGGKRRRAVGQSTMTKPESVTDRQLPFPVLHSLLMWLPSLQSLPENRMLHIKTNCGISTIVVWCYHVLKGLGIVVRSQGVDICFGDERKNIMIEDISTNVASATLMDPIEHHEPLFTLISSEEDPILSHEQRLQAFGFGLKVMSSANVKVEEKRRLSHWIIARALSGLYEKSKSSSSRKDGREKTSVEDNIHDVKDNFHTFEDQTGLELHEVPSEHDVLSAGRFIFALEAIDYDLLEESKVRPLTGIPRALQNQWPSLVAIIMVFARVRPEDLERCENLPISFRGFLELGTSHEGDPKLSASSRNAPVDLMTSFDIMCHLLLGSLFSKEYIKPAVLVSAWGWSIFLDSVDASDPADVSLRSMRVLLGVPSRRGVRRTRIIDGPTSTLLSSSTPVKLCTVPNIVFYPGIGAAKRGNVLVGHQSDAFAVTQTFDWVSTKGTSKGSISSAKDANKTHKMGFRMMFELCAAVVRLRSCDCEEELQEPRQWIDERVSTAEWLDYEYPVATTGCQLNYRLSERVVALQMVDGPGSSRAVLRYLRLFYVTSNPAARWLQLDDMRNSCEEDLEIILRHKDTCFACAVNARIPRSFASPLMLL